VLSKSQTRDVDLGLGQDPCDLGKRPDPIFNGEKQFRRRDRQSPIIMDVDPPLSVSSGFRRIANTVDYSRSNRLKLSILSAVLFTHGGRWRLLNRRGSFAENSKTP
jgi:hypothetical protein